MAILAANGQDPNNPNNNQANTGGGGTVMNSTGGGNAPGVSGGSGGVSAYNGEANTAARPSGNPSGQPNVQDYLNANQGAGQRLESGITNNVQNQANQVNNQVNTNQSQLGNQYNSLNNTLSQGQNAANTAFQDPQALLSAYQNAQAATAGGSAYQGPQANSTDLQNYNAFQGDVAGTNQYNQNQQQLQNYNTSGQQANASSQNQLNNLSQTTGEGANELGRSQLLQQTVGNPNYNQGQQTLDSLFLQGQGNQLQQNLQGIQNNTANTVNSANTDYQTKLNALQNLSGSNTNYAQNLFLNGGNGQNGLNQIGSNVQNEYNALAGPNGTAAQSQQALQNAANTNNFTSDQLAQLGLNANQHTYGLTDQQLLTAGGYAPTAVQAYGSGGAAQAATADQFARYNALNQLAGGPSGALQNSIFGSATQAGYNPYNINQNNIQSAIGNQQSAVSSDLMSQLKTLAGQIQGTSNTSGTGITFNPGIQQQLTSDNSALSQMINSGQIDPTQIQQIAKGFSGIPDMSNGSGTGAGNAGNMFSNWYTNTYLPEATAGINGVASAPGVISTNPNNGLQTGGLTTNTPLKPVTFT